MTRYLMAVPVVLLMAGCATSAPSIYNSRTAAEPGPVPTSLDISDTSTAREVLQSIPPEAALERFELQDDKGRLISYAGLTDGETGGVVFVDKRLVGTLTRAQAQLFYSCRGYVTAVEQHWGVSANAWADALVKVAAPATAVKLTFSGKSTVQSIKSIVENPLVDQVRALVGIGTNPMNIFKTLNKARENIKEQQHDQEMLAALGGMSPGDTEQKLATALRPEAVTFLGNSTVMGYPKYSVEFLVTEAKVHVIQQPSFGQLARDRATLFYQPNVDWSKCTPSQWAEAPRT